MVSSRRVGAREILMLQERIRAAGGEKRVAGAALWFSPSKVLQRRAAAVPGVQSIVKYSFV